MRIEHLKIENFRRFKLVDLELADGVTALVGPNGSGKSTVLEAIGWCLYGNEAARTGKDLIKRRGAAPHEDVRVHLAFRFGANVYEVTRELMGKSEQHSASVKVDGQVVVMAGAQSAKESTHFIEKLFHLDRDAFFTTLVARQRELAALTMAKPAERKKILIGLLRLDAVDAAIVEARQQRRDARSTLTGLRTAMVDTTAMKAQADAVEKAIAAQRISLQEIEGRITKLTDEVEDVRQRRDSGRKLAEEHKLIVTQTAALDARLSHLSEELRRGEDQLVRAREAAAAAALLAPRVEALPATLERVQRLAARQIQHEELKRLRIELARADADAQAAQKEALSAQAAIQVGPALKAEAQALVTERDPREKALAEAQASAAQLQASMQELAKRVNEFTSKEKKVRAIGPEAPCPSCTRPLREHYDALLFGFVSEADAVRGHLAEMSPQLEAARQAEAKARDAMAQLVARETSVRARLEKLASDESRAAASAARVQEAQARAARLRDQEAALAGPPFDPRELDAARLEQRALEAARDEHARLSAQAQRETEIVALRTELTISRDAAAAERAELSSRLAMLAFDASGHAALEKLAEASDARLNGQRVTREKVVGEVLRSEDEHKRLAAELVAQEALAQRAGELEARVRLFEQLAGDRDGGLLPEFKDHLIGRIRPLLSLHMGRLFRELTEGRYADLEVDEQYDLLVHDEGEAFALARFSGGESDLANLCLRLAVSQVVAERAGTEGFGFLALDEIFGSQDEARKSRILHALASLSGRFRQILLITHIVDVKESADHILRAEALDDGTSRLIVDA